MYTHVYVHMNDTEMIETGSDMKSERIETRFWKSLNGMNGKQVMNWKADPWFNIQGTRRTLIVTWIPTATSKWEARIVGDRVNKYKSCIELKSSLSTLVQHTFNRKIMSMICGKHKLFADLIANLCLR